MNVTRHIDWWVGTRSNDVPSQIYLRDDAYWLRVGAHAVVGPLRQEGSGGYRATPATAVYVVGDAQALMKSFVDASAMESVANMHLPSWLAQELESDRDEGAARIPEALEMIAQKSA